MRQNLSTDAQQAAHDSTLSTDKASLRRQLLEQRRALDAGTRAQWDASITQQILTWQQQHDIRQLGVYWPIQSEPDLLACWQQLAARGVQLALPLVIAPQQALRFAAWQPGMAMSRGALGVPVPTEPQWLDIPPALLIPCVGFNLQGYRLGYGGGFYDRTLAQAPATQAFGIAYRCQLAEFASDAHDIALQKIFCNP